MERDVAKQVNKSMIVLGFEHEKTQKSQIKNMKLRLTCFEQRSIEYETKRKRDRNEEGKSLLNVKVRMERTKRRKRPFT